MDNICNVVKGWFIEKKQSSVITFFVNVLKTQKEGFIQSVSAKIPDIIIIKFKQHFLQSLLFFQKKHFGILFCDSSSPHFTCLLSTQIWLKIEASLNRQLLKYAFSSVRQRSSAYFNWQSIILYFQTPLHPQNSVQPETILEKTSAFWIT